MDQSKLKTQTNNELLFQKALSQAVKGISESVSEEEFKKILTFLQSKKSTSRKLAKTLREDLYKNMNSAIEDIFNEETLTEGLEKISRLTEEDTSPHQSDVWRPPGDVKLHLRSHDVKVIQDECEILEKQILNLETENAEKIKILSERRKKLHEMQEKTTRLLNQSKFIVPDMQQMIDIIGEYNDSMN